MSSIEKMMNEAVELASKFYEIDPLVVQITFNKLSANSGWQVYIQQMICDEKGNLIGVDPLYPGSNEFGYPPFGDMDTVYNTLDDFIHALHRSIARKETMLSEKQWNEMAEAPLMFGTVGSHRPA